MWNWLRDNSAALIVLLAALALIYDSNNKVHHRLNDFRTDMNQRFREQSAATDQRLGDMSAIINQRFDAMEREINQRFDAVQREINRRFDAHDERIDRLADEISSLRDLTIRVNDRVSRNEAEISVIRQQLQANDEPSP